MFFFFCISDFCIMMFSKLTYSEYSRPRYINLVKKSVFMLCISCILSTLYGQSIGSKNGKFVELRGFLPNEVKKTERLKKTNWVGSRLLPH